MTADDSIETVVLVSGGIDSAACAAMYANNGGSTTGVFVDYGHPAAIEEFASAEKVCAALGIPLLKTSFSTDRITGPGEIVGRNALLIWSAVFASGIKKGVIAIGVHAGTTYYDCSSTFITRMDNMLAESTNGLVRISAPFVNASKSEVFSYLQRSKVEASLTYSCESGSKEPCGICASCQDRTKLGLR
ncbi:conserved hypothetical protein [Hyphomonas neptunium ATCC 15444]|uniref:7-cyano-7-deazaguanine synthase n=2 Tax=Hyphomonas TaxID=85 RepID=Q0BZ62_HYPNA|nr:MULTISPECIES: 7-cyano-7-deazaguanine synthase [Hyphomonas]ABI76956.1 conserved hypothetical protein [Hyphomonas neptunium ATCC 15444]KCZ95323.1 hypothetical protein HHI_06619 [Hyphomonas hirschiana VP5]